LLHKDEKEDSNNNGNFADHFENDHWGCVDLRLRGKVSELPLVRWRGCSLQVVVAKVKCCCSYHTYRAGTVYRRHITSNWKLLVRLGGHGLVCTIRGNDSHQLGAKKVRCKVRLLWSKEL
jgi:hypothetical protein